MDPTRIVPKYSSRPLQLFTTGRTQPHMTKNVLFPHPFCESRNLAAVFNHSRSGIQIWDSGNGNLVTYAQVSDKVFQIGATDIGHNATINVIDGNNLTVFALKQR